MKNPVNNSLEKSIFLLIIASVFTPLIYSNKLYEGFSATKSIYFQILVEIMLIFWIILTLRSAEFRIKWTLLTIAMFIFFIILFLSDSLGVDSIRSFWSSFDRMEGFNLYVHLVGYFFVASCVIKTKKSWTIIAVTSCFVAGFAAVKGLLSSNLADFDRSFATIGSAIFASIYFMFHFFLTPLLSIKILKNTFKKQSKLYKIFIISLTLFLEILFLVMILKTQTRAAILGLGGGIIVFGLLSSCYFWHNKLVKFTSITAILFIIISTSIIYQKRQSDFIKHNKFLVRFTKFSKVDSAIETRLINWKMAWEGFIEKPILGWGQENYHYVFIKYYNPTLVIEDAWFDRSHNLFLEWLVSGGILLLLAYIGVIVTAFYLLYKNRTNQFLVYDKIFLISAFSAYLIWGIFSIDSISNLFMIFLIFAYIQSVSERSIWISAKFDRFSINNYSKQFRNLTAFGCIVFLIFFIYKVPLRAYQTLKDLSNSMSSTDIDETIFDFKKTYKEALIGKQDIAEEFVARGSIVDRSNLSPETKMNYYQEASKLIETENGRHKDYVRLLNFYGITLLGCNKIDEAIKIYEQSKSLSPKYQISMMQLGLSYLRKNAFQNALKTFEEIYQIEPVYERPLLFKARTYALMGDVTNVQKTIDRISNKGIFSNTPFVKEIYAIENHLDDFLKLFYQSPKREFTGYGGELYYVWATTAFDIGNIDDAIGGLRSYDFHYAYRVEGQAAFINNLIDEMVKNHKRPDGLLKILPLK